MGACVLGCVFRTGSRRERGFGRRALSKEHRYTFRCLHRHKDTQTLTRGPCG